MDHVVRVPVSTHTDAAFPTTNAYCVGTDPAVLVDPAAHDPDLDAVVADRAVEHVVVTHAHPDHVGGVAHYATETGATVWCRTGYADRFAAVAGVTPDRTYHEGTVLPAGDPSLRVLDTPGHAPDHVALAVTPRNADTADGRHDAIAGDVAVAEGSVAVAAPEGDLRAYLVALRRLSGGGFDRLLPGHGPVVCDPKAVCRRLIDHRTDRERRVLAGVRDGCETASDVTDHAYDKDLAGVRDLAERTVVAHLDKLGIEGRIHWDGERARPR